MKRRNQFVICTPRALNLQWESAFLSRRGGPDQPIFDGFAEAVARKRGDNNARAGHAIKLAEIGIEMRGRFREIASRRQVKRRDRRGAGQHGTTKPEEGLAGPDLPAI